MAIKRASKTQKKLNNAIQKQMSKVARPNITALLENIELESWYRSQISKIKFTFIIAGAAWIPFMFIIKVPFHIFIGFSLQALYFRGTWMSTRSNNSPY